MPRRKPFASTTVSSRRSFMKWLLGFGRRRASLRRENFQFLIRDQLTNWLVIREKQFKDRIRAWGFDKKIKMHEMKAIIRKRRLRRQQGKECRFEVRGQVVDEAK